MDDKTMDWMLEIKQSLGRIEAGIENNAQHTSAVSKKADAIRSELQEHVGDSEAHGLGGERRASGRWVSVTGMVIAIISAMIAVSKSWK